VKKRRRVEFQIEHREISIYASSSGLSGTVPSPTPTEIGGLLYLKPEICPTCGSPGMTPLAESLAALNTDLATLQRRINEGSVHLHRSPAGEWRLCTRSLHPNGGDPA
jgi:hypothetical protein